MKKRDFTRFLMLVVALLTASVTNVFGATATLKLTNLGTGLSTTAASTVNTTKVQGDDSKMYTLNYLQGKKTSNGGKNAIFLTKNQGAFISNKTPMPGDIQSITVYILTGAAKATTYYCAFNTVECTSVYTKGSTAVNIPGGENATFNCDTLGARYFCISLGNSNNGQVLGVDVVYTKASTFSLDADLVDFGKVYQNASVNAQTIGASLADATSATVSITGTAFNVSPTTLTEDGDITITPKSTAAMGNFVDTLFLTADDKADTAIIKMSVVEKPVEKSYKWVSNVSALYDGMKIVIVAKDSARALGSTQNANNRSAERVEIKDNTVMVAEGLDVQVISLGKVDDKWSLGVDTGYLYAVSSSNYLKTKPELADDGKWSIDIDANGIASVVCGTRYLQWNKTSNIFSGYTNSQTNVRIFANLDAADTLTIAECVNGSVSASSAGTPIISGSAVNVGTLVTLSNTPADGFKLADYVVYKTDDPDSVITVTDGQFTMPLFPVTVSATFQKALLLESVEITKPANDTLFWVGSTFSAEGLELTATFDTGDSIVTPTAITGYDMATPGAQTVTVSFTEGTITKSDSYTIFVKAIANSRETAYTTAEAIAIIESAGNDLLSKVDVFVKGIVSSVDNYISSTKSISYKLDSDIFTVYSGKNIKGADFASIDDVQVYDTVIVKGILKKYVNNDQLAIYELDKNNQLDTLIRPKILKSIVLSNDTVTEFVVGDEFTAGDMVVVANYNIGQPDTITAKAQWSGYNMVVANVYTVTVSYSENGFTASASYQIVVKPDCPDIVVVTPGQTQNGSIQLSLAGYQCVGVTTTLVATPDKHYHLDSVASVKGDVAVGEVGEIIADTCVISNITDTTVITAFFALDPKMMITFAAGADEATGNAPDTIYDFVNEQVTLPANTFVYAGYKFMGWDDGDSIYAAGAQYTVLDSIELVATWEKLPKWASVYTSNVEVGTDSVVINGLKYGAYKAGTASTAGFTTIKVPAGANMLHFHAAGWSTEKVTLNVEMGKTTLGSFQLPKDAGLTGSTPFSLKNDPAQCEYFCVVLPALAAETEITFTTSSGKRFAIFGVNAVLPPSITINPASYNFRNVKENATATKEFTLIPNAFVEGTMSAAIEGTDADKFSVSPIVDNKLTVTFDPQEIRDNMVASLKVTADTIFAVAELSGNGIDLNTPEIIVDTTMINFGLIRQEASVPDTTIAVSLFNLTSVNVALAGPVFAADQSVVTNDTAIAISLRTDSIGVFTDTLMLTADGAETKAIVLSAQVFDKWSDVYTSNLDIAKEKDTVIIDMVKYEAKKAGTSKEAGEIEVEIPAGAKALHFHAVAWNDEELKLYLTFPGDTLLTAKLYKDAGMKAYSPYTLQGGNYSTEQYFSVPLQNITSDTLITFSAHGRFAIYGVNQEGAPEITSIEISGQADQLEYFENDTFNPKGLVVTAHYEQEAPDRVITDRCQFTFDPQVLSVATDSVQVVASFKKYVSEPFIVKNIVVSPLVADTLMIEGKYPTRFHVGDEFTTDSMVVIAYYNNGTNKDVTDQADFSQPDMSVAGKQLVTITYSGASTSYTITVLSKSSLFYESFDTNIGTGGNDGAWNGSIATGKVLSDNEGWECSNAGGAYQCARLGTATATGTASTPVIMNGTKPAKGNFAVTFLAAAWSSDTEKQTLNVSATAGELETSVTVDLDKGAWKEYTLYFSCFEDDGFRIKFTGSVSKNRFFLDEVEVKHASKPTDCPSVLQSSVPTRKLIMGDQLLILRDGRMFNAQGQLLK